MYLVKDKSIMLRLRFSPHTALRCIMHYHYGERREGGEICALCLMPYSSRSLKSTLCCLCARIAGSSSKHVGSDGGSTGGRSQTGRRLQKARTAATVRFSEVHHISDMLCSKRRQREAGMSLNNMAEAMAAFWAATHVATEFA